MTVAERARELVKQGRSVQEAINEAGGFPAAPSRPRAAPPNEEKPAAPLFRLEPAAPEEDRVVLEDYRAEVGASGRLWARLEIWLDRGRQRVMNPAGETTRRRADEVLGPVVEQFRKSDEFKALAGLRKRRAEFAAEGAKRQQAVAAAEARRAEALASAPGPQAMQAAESCLDSARYHHGKVSAQLAEIETRLEAAERQTAAALLALVGKAAAVELAEGRRRREQAAQALAESVAALLPAVEAEAALESLLRPELVRRQYGE